MNLKRKQGLSGGGRVLFGWLPFVVATLVLYGCGPGAQSDGESASVAAAANESMEFAVVHGIPGAQLPTVAVDDRSGAVYVAYFVMEEADDRQVTNVYLVARRDGTWGTPVRVNSDPGEADAHAQAPAQVDVTTGGTVIVVWTNAIPVEGRRFDASNLFVARSTDGGRTFSPQRAINTDANGIPAGHTFHDVSVSTDGTIYVSWLDSRERYRAEAEMTVESEPLSTHAHHGMPADDDSMPGTEVRVARSIDGGVTFGEGVVAADNVCPCCRTSLATTRDGSVYVGWRHIFDNGRDPAMAWSTDGGVTFSAPERIHADAWTIDGCPHAGPSMAFDSDGRLHVAWYTGVDAAPGLYYGRSEAGRAVDAAEPLIVGVGVSQARVASSGDWTWIAWEDQRRGSVHISTQRGAELPADVFVIDGARLPAIAAVTDGAIAATQSPGGVDVSEIWLDRGDTATH